MAAATSAAAFFFAAGTGFMRMEVIAHPVGCGWEWYHVSFLPCQAFFVPVGP